MQALNGKLFTGSTAALIAFASCTVIGLVIADRVMASSDETSGTRVNTFQEAPATKDFPTNGNGLTYGSDAFVEDDEAGPDLVAVVGNHGMAGYVKRTDLDGPRFSTPEQALEWQHQNRGDVVIDVYDVTGAKVIDTFTMVVPTVDTDD